MKKFLIFVAICIAGYYLYNLDAVYGEYLFNQMCKNEGGARFFKRVEKGQGWACFQDGVYCKEDMKHLGLTSDRNRGFTRFRDEAGNLYDARLKSDPPPGTSGDVINSPEFTRIDPANLSIPVRYTERTIVEKFNPDTKWLKKQKFVKSQSQIIDLKTNEIVATYTWFQYQWTSPDRVILNAPTGVSCPTPIDNGYNFTANSYQQGETK